jgi:flagellar basal body-associated protein FliL
MKSGWAIGLGMAASLWGAQAWASGGGDAPAEGVNYIAITPPLIVNYGGPGQVRYIKAELSIRAENAEDATEVIHHLPLIRDRLVSILSAQTEERISTAEGKEYLRIYALSEINKALLKVEGHEAHADDSHAASAASGKTEKPSEHGEGAATAFASTADIKPVKGPASDLFFNNFVVQK